METQDLILLGNMISGSLIGLVNLTVLIGIWWKLDTKIENMNKKIDDTVRTLREESNSAHAGITAHVGGVDKKIDDLKDILLRSLLQEKER